MPFPWILATARPAASCMDTERSQYSTPYLSRILKPSSSQAPGMRKMAIVSNTRVDIVARGVIKACLELGYDPAEKIAIFRIPGAWEDEGYKILERYGVEYADRSVSMHEAARRAVEKIQGAAA